MKNYYFISGLPRSGSTLLCNILAQNPDFYVSKSTSGCHDVLFGIRNQWDRLVEHQAGGIDYDQLKRVLRSALDSYHNTDKNMVWDKGRGWLSVLEMAQFVLGSDIKVIVPVRNVNEILASFEGLWRKTTGFTQWNFEQGDYFKAQTVGGRCEIWASNNQPLGLAYNRVIDALSRGFAKNMLFIEFDNLTTKPLDTMMQIYNFVGLPYYDHKFDVVEQVTQEDDENVHRIPGLHTIRPKVEPVPHKAANILGRDLANKYANLEVWR